MNFKEFETVVNRYQKKEGAAKDYNIYRIALERRDIWEKLDQVKDGDIKSVMLKFLNKWKCRIKVSPGLIENLRTKSRFLYKYFKAVNKEKLENLDFNKRFNINGKFLKIEGIIFKIYDSLYKTKFCTKSRQRNFGATAASKFMHMVNPDLFVMFDINIRAHYGCGENANGYVNFMWRMHRLCNKIIADCSAKSKIDHISAKRKILNIFNKDCGMPKELFTLPKIIDEYNYLKYTLESKKI